MSKDITINNIYNFIEGNINLFTSSLQPKHIKEQIAYRMLKCKDDCAITKKCINCGCDYPGRIHTSQSCNNNRFPDLMGRIEWEEFKKRNKIE